MSAAKFKVGDEVFVRDPGRYVKNARSLTGVIDRVTAIGSSFKYEFDVDRIAINTGEGTLDFRWAAGRRVSIFEIDLGERGGIPISELDGRNGGNAAWREFCASWGHP